MTKILVLYYSAYGHIETMAGAIAEGARDDKPPALTRFEVTPGVRRLDSANPAVQLVAKAHFADGSVLQI